MPELMDAVIFILLAMAGYGAGILFLMALFGKVTRMERAILVGAGSLLFACALYASLVAGK